MITGAFALNYLLVHLVTDFNKGIITIFDVVFGTLVLHFSAHFLLAPLASLMREAQGAAQKNAWLREGRTSVRDKPRLGRPAEAVTPTNVEVFVNKDQRVTLQEVASV